MCSRDKRQREWEDEANLPDIRRIFGTWLTSYLNIPLFCHAHPHSRPSPSPGPKNKNGRERGEGRAKRRTRVKCCVWQTAPTHVCVCVCPALSGPITKVVVQPFLVKSDLKQLDISSSPPPLPSITCKLVQVRLVHYVWYVYEACCVVVAAKMARFPHALLSLLVTAPPIRPWTLLCYVEPLDSLHAHHAKTCLMWLGKRMGCSASV